MTQRLLKTIEFTDILQVKDSSFQLTDDDLNLHQNSLEGKVVPLDLKTVKTQILSKKCILECFTVKNLIKCCQKYNF